MKLTQTLKSLGICMAIIAAVFVAVSFFDILISVMYARFYSNAAFVVTFGVGGIFAAVLGYMNGIDIVPREDQVTRWILILFQILAGLCFFFILAKLEGGEYEAAFKGYGVTLALGSLLFVKENIR